MLSSNVFYICIKDNMLNTIFNPIQNNQGASELKLNYTTIQNETSAFKNILHFAMSKSAISKEIRKHLADYTKIDGVLLHDLGHFNSSQIASDMNQHALQDVKHPLLLVDNISHQYLHAQGVTSLISDRRYSSYDGDFFSMGFQRHLNGIGSKRNDIQNEMLSLGSIRKNTAIVEPTLRDSETIHIDLSCLRSSDVHNSKASPTGLYAEELCQISRYIGESQNLKLITINTIEDNILDARLVCSIIWYVLEGMVHRINSNPIENIDEFDTYLVDLQSNEDRQLTFYRHKESNKWWVNSITQNDRLISCSQMEYEAAINGNISNRLLIQL